MVTHPYTSILPRISFGEKIRFVLCEADADVDAGQNAMDRGREIWRLAAGGWMRNKRTRVSRCTRNGGVDGEDN